MHYPTLTRGAAAAALLFLPLLMNAKEKKNSNYSVFSTYRTLPSNKDAMEQTRTKVSTIFPGWMAATDKLNGLFTDVNGAPVTIEGADLTTKSANVIARLSSLGIISGEWVKVKQYSSPKADYVNYKQVVNGHEVAFATLKLRYTKAGTLARIEMKNFGEPGATNLKVSAATAKATAIKDIAGLTTSAVNVDADWAWFPIPHAGGYTLHPAWHFTAKGKIAGRIPQELRGYVDAVTGELLYRTNDVKETGFDLTIKGMVYKNGTLNPATLEPLPDLQVAMPLGGVLTTDTNGYCSNPLLSLPLSPDVPLAGLWSTVNDDPTFTTPDFLTTVSVLGSVYTYPTTAPSSSRHVNAYYHVNRVHNFMKSFWPTFTGMDFSLPTNVDVSSGACNAFYDGTSINFYAAGSGCNSFAEMGDVIYHEYGHGISDHFYQDLTGSSIQNGSLNEACSDVWAMSITHNPILGQNSFTSSGGWIRRYDISPQVYPLDITTPMVWDPHYTGQIIAGCWWDVGVNLGDIHAMTQLFTDVYYDLPDGVDGTEGDIYRSILISTLLADDVDANISNGTPHYDQILSAFAKHGIYLEGESTLTHTEPNNPAAASPIPVSASLLTTYSTYLHDLTLYYRVNGTGTWTPLTMTLGSGVYTASIPAQPTGTTVEYYFAMHDALNNDNGYFPVGFNPNQPAQQVTIPYQFSVGLMTAINYSFDTSATGWTLGVTGDNATEGTWTLGTPTPFFDPGISPFLDINGFAGNDHTTGHGKCLMAGKGGDTATSILVTAGTTTAQSPVFDLTNYSKPVFEYWRWFSSEFVFAEIKNDPWITQIRDASSSSNPWQTIERTYRSDQEWRHKVVNIRQYLPTANKVQMRFVISDSVLSSWSNDGQSQVTGDIDDFSLRDDHSHVGVADLNAEQAAIVPNPADNILNITLAENNAGGAIQLYDVTGRLVLKTAITANNNKYALNTANLTAGVYTLSVITGTNTQITKVVVAH